jgi:hypothetical protein
MSLRRPAYPPGSKPMSRIRSYPSRNAVLSVGRLRPPASAGALDRTICAITLMGENRTDRHHCARYVGCSDRWVKALDIESRCCSVTHASARLGEVASLTGVGSR